MAAVTPKRPLLRAAGIGAFLAVAGAASPASASPGVDGVRALGTAGTGRSSALGVAAALNNPSTMGLTQQFAMEPMYQLNLENKSHGLGVVALDSLNNPRFGLALGYLFLKGAPQLNYQPVGGGERQNLELSHFGHEAFLSANVWIVQRWLSFASKFKFQYTSMRYRNEADGSAPDLRPAQKLFGLDTSLTLDLAEYVSVSAIAENLVGNMDPNLVDPTAVDLEGVDAIDGTVQHGTLSRVSDYPLTLHHSLSVFPLRGPDLSLNFDGSYDFTSFKSDDVVRKVYGGSAEYYIARMVPLRAGASWDSMNDGSDDDRVFVGGGLAYVRAPQIGGTGVEIGAGLRQQVSGPARETIFGLSLTLRVHPDL